MHLISINDQPAKIQDGTLKLLHVIDLTYYQDILDDMTNYTEHHVSKSNPFYSTIHFELSQTIELLNTVNPKKKRRALDFLGTAWKYIAGSPDHNDLEMLTENINNIAQNNNKQILINKQNNERLNNLTKISNELTNIIKKDNKIIDEIAINTQQRLRLLKEEIVNIKFAIQWAKVNMINTMLLNKNELKLAIETLNKENIPFKTIEEAMEFADVAVMSNERKLLYVIKIPLTLIQTYKNLIIRPVKKGNLVPQLVYKEILVNSNEIFGINNECKKYNSVKICGKNQITNISDSNCIPKLINGFNSSCTYTNDHHIPTIEQIGPGIILLNDFNGTIYYLSKNQSLSGTFLIKFHNTSFKINDQLFRNTEISTLDLLPAIFQPTPEEKKRIQLLSLESLNELHLNNTKEIALIQTHNVVYKSITFTTITIIIIIISIMILLQKNRKVLIVNNTLPDPEAVTQNISFQLPKIQQNNSSQLPKDPQNISSQLPKDTQNTSSKISLPDLYNSSFF